jgi:hypothetical protein
MTTDKKIKKLSEIMSGNKHFDHAIKMYIEYLERKRDKQNIEKRILEFKKKGWPKDKIKKMSEWERKAIEMQKKIVELSMREIRHMADNISEQQFEDLGEWIKKSSHSKEAWDRNVVSSNDSFSVIKAKVMHLAYMSRAPAPVNIGEMLKANK